MRSGRTRSRFFSVGMVSSLGWLQSLQGGILFVFVFYLVGPSNVPPPRPYAISFPLTTNRLGQVWRHTECFPMGPDRKPELAILFPEVFAGINPDNSLNKPRFSSKLWNRAIEMKVWEKVVFCFAFVLLLEVYFNHGVLRASVSSGQKSHQTRAKSQKRASVGGKRGWGRSSSLAGGQGWVRERKDWRGLYTSLREWRSQVRGAVVGRDSPTFGDPQQHPTPKPSLKFPRYRALLGWPRAPTLLSKVTTHSGRQLELRIWLAANTRTRLQLATIGTFLVIVFIVSVGEPERPEKPKN